MFRLAVARFALAIATAAQLAHQIYERKSA